MNKLIAFTQLTERLERFFKTWDRYMDSISNHHLKHLRGILDCLRKDVQAITEATDSPREEAENDVCSDYGDGPSPQFDEATIQRSREEFARGEFLTSEQWSAELRGDKPIGRRELAESIREIWVDKPIDFVTAFKQIADRLDPPPPFEKNTPKEPADEAAVREAKIRELVAVVEALKVMDEVTCSQPLTFKHVVVVSKECWAEHEAREAKIRELVEAVDSYVDSHGWRRCGHLGPLPRRILAALEALKEV